MIMFNLACMHYDSTSKNVYMLHLTCIMIIQSIYHTYIMMILTNLSTLPELADSRGDREGGAVYRGGGAAPV